jgi:transposase
MDEALEGRLYRRPRWRPRIVGRRRTGRWCTALRRPGVLWEEHRAAHPDGYGYGRFCELYRAWEARLSP